MVCPGGGPGCPNGELPPVVPAPREFPPQPVCNCMITAFLRALPTFAFFLSENASSAKSSPYALLPLVTLLTHLLLTRHCKLYFAT